MIIVYLNDGLGNQMFQFALYRKLRALGKAAVIYDQDLRSKNALHNGLELERVFQLQYNSLSRAAFRKYDTKCLLNHIIRKCFYEKKYPIYEEKGLSYNPDIFLVDYGCLKGYWQSELYFEGLEKQIRMDFSFPSLDTVRNKGLLDDIKTTNSVAIHVRRGDYMNDQYKNVFGCVCNEKYYINAMRYMENRVDHIKFFIFSNDMPWCRRFFKNKNTVFVEGNSGERSYVDMHLMSQCKHQIIANSSFSWWAAWLNNNPDKIVLSPSKWINGIDVTGIWCRGWVKIN